MVSSPETIHLSNSALISSWTSAGISSKEATDLSKITGIDKGSISHYIKGTYKAKDKSLEKLANALNVDVAWLMGYDVPMTKSDNNSVSNEDLKFALFGGEITDEQRALQILIKSKELIL